MDAADHRESQRGHVVVFGFQGVGRRIVRQLTTTGRRVVVVDPNADAAQQVDLQRWGATYLAGYGDSQDTLVAANVVAADAVLCVTDDDVRNIRLALLARDLSEDVRIVVRMANASVARALQPVAEPGAVLDVAALAAPSFVEAALNRRTHTLRLGGQEFVVATQTSPTAATIATVWGDLAPVAVRASDGTTMVSGPSAGHRVESGERVTLIGTRDDYHRLGFATEPEHVDAIGPTLRRRTREAVAAMSDAVDRPFRIAFGILLVLGLVSITVLMAAYEEADGTHMSLLDAVYFTAETVATVGFGDFYFRDQPSWLRLWAVVLIVMGAALVAIATALLTNALVSRRLEQSLGRQRLTGLQDHIVVIGLGRVGSAVAIGLRDAGYEVAVIDGGEGQRFVPQMREAGIPVLIGDATLPDTQAAAGIHRAAGVAVLTSDDLVNIETGLAVRGVMGDRPVPIALRLFSRNLARLVGAELDAGVARSIAELASPWFVGAALGIEVIGTFYVGPSLFIAARFVVHPGGSLDGRSVADFEGRARVVAVDRGDGAGLVHPPDPGIVFVPGDSAYVIGQYDGLLSMLQGA